MDRKEARKAHMRQAFNDAYVATGSAPYAAQKAGYAFPAKAGPRLVRENYAELTERFAEFIVHELRPAAMREHLRLLNDPNCPAGPKGFLIKLAFDRGDAIDGMGAGQKDLCDMSAAELQSYAAKLRAAAEAARLVVPLELEPSLVGGVFD